MICQNCNQRKASILSLDLHDGEWVQRSLCDTCAMGGGNAAGDGPDASVLQLFSQMLGDAGARVGETGQACGGCGMTFREFQDVRRLGCARCYETFAGELERIFLRVQDEVVHRGKVPGRPKNAPPSPLELRRLRENLSRAIEQEKFEEAAVLRDKIREITGEGGVVPGEDG